MRGSVAVQDSKAEDDAPHRRLEAPRLFKLTGLIRRCMAPGARRELGMSDFEWRGMSQVGDRAPMSLNELAAVTGHDKGQLSRGVSRLVDAGMLVRESRRGARGVFISPTKAGKEAFARLVAHSKTQNEALVQGLTPQEIKLFSAVIDKLEANAMNMLAGEQDASEAPLTDNAK